MIITSKSFIDNYLHRYHAMRADYLSRTLQKLSDQKAQSKEEESNKTDYLYTVTIDIRSNAYHAAETLLDFLSVLIDQYDKRVDHDLGKALLNSKSSSAYELAKKIVSNDQYLNCLKQQIKVYNQELTLFKFCFHFAITVAEKDYETLVDGTLTIIKAAARLLSDREEYNAYKHSLRVVPNPYKTMFFKPKEDKSKINLKMDKPTIKFDSDTAVSFWSRIPNKDKTLATEPIRSKTLNSARDLNLATLCSMLITNIICARKPHFGSDKTYDATKSVHLPTKAKVDEALDQGSGIDDVVLTSRFEENG